MRPGEVDGDSDDGAASTERAPSRTTGVRIVASLVILHALTAFPYPWETATLGSSLLVLDTDLLAVLVVALGLALRFGRRAVVAHVAAPALLLVPVYRFGATIMPAFYGKELDAYNDSLMLPGLVHLLLVEYPVWLQVVFSVLALTLALAAYVVTVRLVRCVLAVTAHPRLAVRGWQALVLLLGLAGLDLATSDSPGGNGGRVASESRLVGAANEARHVWREWRFAATYPAHLAEAAARVEELPRDLARLRGADVFVLFVESYGRSLLRADEIGDEMRAWGSEWSRELEADGFFAVSGSCFPWISGGASSLAHAAFLSGVLVHNRRAFDELLESDLVPLPRAFQDAGYLTLSVQPMMTESWPAGAAFFGFDEELFRDRLDYHGRSHHWGDMPDQFALARLLEHVRASAGPLFAQYVSVTSHAPFHTLPRYYEDWSKALAPDAFDEPAATYPLDWLNYSGHPRLEEAYVASIRYTLQSVIDFVRQLPRRSLVLVLGDHQPPNVGRISRGDDSFDVPFHVISNDRTLLEPFALSGFHQGFMPPNDLPSFDSAFFLERFLRAFSDGGGD